MQTIAVLLTVHNRKEKTLACLDNLHKQLPITGYSVDIYLTDDGCTDGTPEAIREQYPEMNIIKGNGNLFWNRGMYTAWEKATETKDYDFYLWLNDDTFVYPNMLVTLLKDSESKGDKAIIIGATQSADHTRATYGGRLGNGKIPTPDGTLAEVTHFNGNIALIPRYAYHILGNLDYYFTHSKGDFDYGLRAKKKSIKMYQSEEFLGECEQHESIDKWCNPDVPFRQRWKALYSPTGMPPKETFHLEKRHCGIITATFHYLTIHLRCLLPELWNKRNKKQMKNIQ